jgi:hypothetical protein
MRLVAFAVLAAGALASPALAQSEVILTSAVFVEHLGHTGDGRIERQIKPATRLTPGDTVVLMVEWRARPDGKGFYVTSPIPGTLAYSGSSRDGEQVSVDHGRHWGALGTLALRDAYGARLASPEDVTDVRWAVSAREAALGGGRITYSAMVR